MTQVGWYVCDMLLLALCCTQWCAHLLFRCVQNLQFVKWEVTVQVLLLM